MSKKTSKPVKDNSLAEQAAIIQKQKDAAVASSMQDTVAGEIWNEIKEKNIEMFALPDQKVHMHCHPINIEPTKLYLLTNSSAVLPSLESAVGKHYTVELADRFVVVARAAVSPTRR